MVKRLIATLPLWLVGIFATLYFLQLSTTLDFNTLGSHYFHQYQGQRSAVPCYIVIFSLKRTNTIDSMKIFCLRKSHQDYEPRWRSRRTCSHSLLREHQNHNQLLDNHRQEDTGTHQKRHPTSKDKGQATMRRQEGHNHSKSNSHNCRVGDSQTGEHLYHRSPPTGVKVLSPMSVSQPGGPATGGGILRESDFEGQWDLTAGL